MGRDRALIVFDLDGTLIDSVHLVARIVNERRRATGAATHTVAQYRAWFGHGLQQLVHRAYHAPATGEGGSGSNGTTHPPTVELEQHYTAIKRAYAQRAATETPAYRGIRAALTHCRQQARLAILTNKIENITRDIVTALFPHTFDDICGLTDRYHPKPDPQRLLLLLRRYRIAVGNCVMVGDSVIDYQTARNAGVAFCAVGWGYEPLSHLRQRGATVWATDPNKLPPCIDSIMAQ